MPKFWPAIYQSRSRILYTLKMRMCDKEYLPFCHRSLNAIFREKKTRQLFGITVK